jgi:hypothetical protein
MKKLLNFTPNFFQILVKFRTRKKNSKVILKFLSKKRQIFFIKHHWQCHP